ncbi:MAG: heavy-metal-associated domain-containing protein [Bacteroidales bacterium]|nr:heavy-metal-associated domain-containing protein [Bacteroidales bacterium]
MRIFLIIFSIAVLGAACSLSGSKSAGDKSSGQETGLEANLPQENLKLVHLNVSGMTCEGCENAVVKSIENLDGIREVSASYTAEEAIVRFDTTKTSMDAISGAIADAGYKYGGEKPAAN